MSNTDTDDKAKFVCHKEANKFNRGDKTQKSILLIEAFFRRYSHHHSSNACGLGRIPQDTGLE